MSWTRVGGVVLLLLATVGRADAGEARVRELDAAGRRDFDAGHYRDAAAAFEAAYEESGELPVLWNTARAYHLLYTIERDPAHLLHARLLYEKFADLSDAVGKARAAKEVEDCDVQLRVAGPGPGSPRTARYEKRVATGRALTIIGIVNVVIAAVGVGLTVASFGSRQDDEGFGILLGIVPAAAAGGVALIMFGIGIPLWAVGQHQLNKISLSPMVTPGGAKGLSLSLRF